MTRSGPLSGLRIVEFAGIGPGPFCGMLLSDLGADIIRVDRAGQPPWPFDVTGRNRRSVVIDLKSPDGVEACLKLAESADALIEGYRPGVMERLGLGPDAALARNRKLVYGRMTGWGQSGPYAQMAGHDLNYIAISGALNAIGTAEKPIPPLNLVGDYGGGALYLAMGLLAGVIHARASGEGQVVDCAMSDGAASLMSVFYGVRAHGELPTERGTTVLDGASPYYGAYACADGRFVAVGAIEPQFYVVLLEKLALDAATLPDRDDPANWPELRRRFAEAFARKSRDEWCAILGGSDACFGPVLDYDEAPRDPHNLARRTFVEVAGVVQPAPAPRFSATPGAIRSPPPKLGEHGRDALADWGFSEAAIAELERSGALRPQAQFAEA
jgi:alpha-methylacyl-CoA racemase